MRMKRGDGVAVCYTRGYDFSAARVAGHKVRLNEARYDFYFGAGKVAVELYRSPVRRKAQVVVVLVA